MKEIIPLKKDIIFKTKISEITNISLEHDYKVFDDIVSGKVVLSGTYKMTEASVNQEEFFYDIPFSIAIGERIKKDSVKIEIDDFNYKIEKDVMKVNIELELVCDEKEETIIKENTLEEYFNEEEFILSKEKDDKKEVTIKEEPKETDSETIDNIKKLIDTEEKYVSYKVYIVRHGDTIESICNKYNLLVDDIKEYNDLSSINVGDKIIIPQIINE